MSDDKGSGRGLDATGLWIVLVVVVVLGGVVLLGGRDGGRYEPPKPEPWAGWKTTGIVALALVGLLVAGLVCIPWSDWPSPWLPPGTLTGTRQPSTP